MRSSRSRGSKSRENQISFGDFVPDTTMSEIQRAAQFLHWAAEHMPMRFVPYTWLAKHSIVKPKLPSVMSPEVEFVRKKLTSIKQVLWEKFSRRTVPAPRGQELGIRATVDDDDLAGTDFLRNKRRVYSGIKRLEDTRSKLDPENMRDNGLRQMVQNMDPVLKKLTSGDLMNRLRELPPRKDDD